MSATQINKPFARSDAVRFAEAMEKVCGLLSTVGEGVPHDLRMALLNAKREAYMARDLATDMHAS